MSAPNIAWDMRMEKAQARELLLRDLPASKTALFLPAGGCICVQTALRLGAINQYTWIAAVERDPKTFEIMRHTLEQLGFNGVACRGKLHEWRPTRDVDLAFLDLNGAITSSIAAWIANHLAYSWSVGGRLIVAISAQWRKNVFLPRISEQMIKHAPDLVESTADELRIANYDIILTVTLFKILFRDWDFDTDLFLKYKDTTWPMTAYRFSGFRRRGIALPYELAAGDMVKGNLGLLARSPKVPRKSRAE